MLEDGETLETIGITDENQSVVEDLHYDLKKLLLVSVCGANGEEEQYEEWLVSRGYETTQEPILHEHPKHQELWMRYCQNDA